VFHWAILSARLWNKMCEMSPSRLLHQSFLANINLCVVAKSRLCWVFRMLKLARTMGYITESPCTMPAARVLSLRFDEATLGGDLHAKFMAFWVGAHATPRNAPSTFVTASTYACWIGMGGSETIKAPHLHTSLSFPLRRALLSIRLGAHKLEIQRGRFRNVPRAQRVCRLHDGAHVEDVMHFMLDCPLYTTVPARFPTLFGPLNALAAPDERLRALFATEHQHALALCIHGMLERRNSLLEEQSVAI
jgi:hypothetical protein